MLPSGARLPWHTLFQVAPWHAVADCNRSACFSLSRHYASTINSIPVPPPLFELKTSGDMNSARHWVELFKKVTIPREAVELSFSRSSGPGGQNVNKVNTKSTAKCPLSTKWIPSWAKQALRGNPAYVASSDSLLITSTLHRSQAHNVDDCLSKLRSLVVAASLQGVKNETSEEQKERVKLFRRVEKARRKQEKDHKSKLKQTRKKGGWD